MPEKRTAPAKRWCFTWNNYPDDWAGSILPILKPISSYVIGKEIGKKGTPHLQAYVEFNKKVRALSVGLPKEIHWEKTRKGRIRNINYCTKDGDYVSHELDGVPVPVSKMTFSMLRPAQKAISALFSGREDPLHGRTIYWFWETSGSWGKSLTTMHLIDCRGALVLGGKRSDILCGIAAVKKETGEVPPLVIFDLPRTAGNRVSYSAMESVKNGYFFSGKYESGMCRFNRPHIAVFANSPPLTAELSGDRWRVRNLVQWDKLMAEIRDYR